MRILGLEMNWDYYRDMMPHRSWHNVSIQDQTLGLHYISVSQFLISLLKSVENITNFVFACSSETPLKQA